MKEKFLFSENDTSAWKMTAARKQNSEKNRTKLKFPRTNDFIVFKSKVHKYRRKLEYDWSDKIIHFSWLVALHVCSGLVNRILKPNKK